MFPARLDGNRASGTPHHAVDLERTLVLVGVGVHGLGRGGGRFRGRSGLLLSRALAGGLWGVGHGRRVLGQRDGLHGGWQRLHHDGCRGGGVVLLTHLLGGIEAGQFGREGAAQRKGFGNLCQHHAWHLRPHAGQAAVLLALGVLAEQGDGVDCLHEPLAVDADAGGGGRLVVEPNVGPLAVRPAERDRGLPCVLAAALSNQAESVDADLRLHHLAAGAAIPPLHGVNLTGEGVQPGAVADAEEQLHLVAARSRAKGAGEQVALLVIQSCQCSHCDFLS